MIDYKELLDRQLNNWLHKYLYTHIHDGNDGCQLRKIHESGDKRTEDEFERRVQDVLFGR